MMGAEREEKFAGKNALNIDGRLPTGGLMEAVFRMESHRVAQMEREGVRMDAEVHDVGGPSRR